MRTMVVVVLLLVGCASSPQQSPGTTPRASAAPGASGNDDDVRCQDEVPTGTLLHRTVCRDQFERDGEQKNVERWMKTPRANPGGPK
ncbi:MAG: hypothetical protein E6J90_48420 [Deltaproteobacteria bacterium]|nr:MAG: hypothetical protein E6J90_48420 [Deltaproteobacteria bacterium]TMQ23063.1 MAG: hypothetical protein E6J91_00530 [Deltaproteobacteria bacterium]